MDELPQPHAATIYTDRFRLSWEGEPIDEGFLSELRRTSGAASVHDDRLDFQYLDICQPTPDSLDILMEYLGWRHDCGLGPPADKLALCYVEIATDFLFHTQVEAEAALAYIHQRAVLRHCRDAPRRAGDMYYLAGRKAGRNVALYADRTSKITGTPCLHIEQRIRRGRSCRSVGLGTLPDLMGLDHLQFALSKHFFGEKVVLQEPWTLKHFRGLDLSAPAAKLRYQMRASRGRVAAGAFQTIPLPWRLIALYRPAFPVHGSHPSDYTDTLFWKGERTVDQPSEGRPSCAVA